MRRALVLVSVVALVLMAATAASQEQGPAVEDDVRAQALTRLHPLLAQYHAETGESPVDVLDLYLEGFAGDAGALFVAGSPEAQLGATVPSRSSSSFYMLRSDWSGWVACTEPVGRGEVFKLHVDGRVERDTYSPGEFFGEAPRLPFSCAVEDADLDRPAAQLGVALTEVSYDHFLIGGWTDLSGAVLVRAVIPGYRSWYPEHNGLRGPLHPGDRLVRVGGRRVESLADVNAILPHVGRGRDLDLVVLRGGAVLHVDALMPSLPDVEQDVVPRDPRLVAAAARICLQGNGPGLLGVHSLPVAGGVRVAQVGPGSAALRAGITAGDVITAAAGHPVKSTPHLVWLIRAHPAGSSVELSLRRDGVERTATATLGGLDADALSRARFTIRANQLAVDEALPYAGTSLYADPIVALIQGRKGSTEALRWVERAVEKPTTIQATPLGQSLLLRARGRLRGRDGRWKEAVADLDRAHQLVSLGDPPLLETADILFTWRQYADALGRYTLARNAADAFDRAAITLRVARCLVELGRKDEARRELTAIRDHEVFGKPRSSDARRTAVDPRPACRRRDGVRGKVDPAVAIVLDQPERRNWSG